MINRLHLKNVGLFADEELHFAPRLNLITGGNGLGKSFLLNLTWFALTGVWPKNVQPSLPGGLMALPTDLNAEASLEASFDGADGETALRSRFERGDWRWSRRDTSVHSSDVLIWATADGGFALWDPSRNGPKAQAQGLPPAHILTDDQVMNGLPGTDLKWLCMGFVRDGLLWWGDRYFEEELNLFTKVLAALSDADGPMTLERARLVDPLDIRRIPVIGMPDGVRVPVTHASTGVRKVVKLAYMLVWQWTEHVRTRDALGLPPARRIVLLWDDADAGLSPRRQREVLPGLMRAMKLLPGEPDVQFVVTTRSPLVMSSVELDFRSDVDRWFDLDGEEGRVKVRAREYLPMGGVGNWLTSEAFDLPTEYSVGTERVLEEAKALMRRWRDVPAEELLEMTKKLGKVLPDADPYWINWNAMLFRRGIEP